MQEMADTPGPSWLDNRWVQLAAGVLAMVAIANLQYGWTLFVEPIQKAFGWERAAIQVAFTLFVLSETWLVPVEGYLVDRFGPRIMVAAGGILVGLAWVINSWATSLATLYAGGILGGTGAGVVYGASIGSALKWFPTRRGLAAGITSAAFGAGSALTVLPISALIRDSGYQSAFFWFGIGQGTVVLLCALVLRAPRLPTASSSSDTSPARPGRDYTCGEMVCTPIFWLLYGMFTMMAMGGLMVTAQIGTIAKDYRVADVPVEFLGLTTTALTFALALDRVLNGLTRPFFGWVSDRIGRENTMFVAFTLEGLAILLLISFAHVPLLFILLTGLTFFAWGEIYSLFPALCGDLFGRKFATTNYGLLYTAKGTASLLVPLGSLLKDCTGSWVPIFVLAIVFDWLAALLALFVLKPAARRMSAKTEENSKTDR